MEIKTSVKRIVEMLGGKFIETIDGEIPTHIIINKKCGVVYESTKNNSNIKLVRYTWFIKCIEKNEIIDETLYSIISPTNNVGCQTEI